MQLQTWANEERGRGLMLAKALGVQPPSISDWITGKKQVPAERCPSIEQFTDRQVTCEEMRPDVDWAYLRNSGANTAQTQTTPSPVAADLIAVVKAAIDEVVHQADDRLAELKKDAQVEMKHTSLEVRGEIEKDAHDALERLTAPKVWDGKDRRDGASAAGLPWDGTERRSQPDRRHPEVLEAPAQITAKGA